MQEPEVIIQQQGAAGIITLNRPKALNALTQNMVHLIENALHAFEAEARITRVVVKGAGEKAFCAGGDIRQVHDLGRAGRVPEALSFFREEYIMNRHIKRYSKPYISLIDGIVMGGGVGVSQHGTYIVGGEKYLFAMPEVGIGFFPDVGGTFALSRLPWNSGSYLAMSGARIGRADALALGLLTHVAAGSSFGAIEAALIAGEPVEKVLAAHGVHPEAAPILQHRAEIEHIFAGNTVAEVFSALEKTASTSAFAASTLKMMQTKSPTSMALALEQMRRGASLSFEDAMQLEMRIVSRIAEGEDFYEGVRAVIIDKDQKPRWNPAAITDIDPSAIARHFEPLPHDLVF